MAKVVIKTQETKASVAAYIDAQKDEQVRDDCRALVKLMSAVTGEKPRMWGSSMIGFGNRVYTSSATGRQVDWMVCGFSPRKANLSLHLTTDISKQAALLKKLGKHKTGVGCLYVKKLADVDLKVLEQLVRAAVKGKS